MTLVLADVGQFMILL